MTLSYLLVKICGWINFKVATMDHNKGFTLSIFCIPYADFKWMKTVWDLGILQQAFIVCLYIDD